MPATGPVHTSVESSNLHSVGYDKERGVLEIQFRGGGLYEYYTVPERIYTELISAPSKGQFFHQNIRNIFRYRKLARRPRDAPRS